MGTFKRVYPTNQEWSRHIKFNNREFHLRSVYDNEKPRMDRKYYLRNNQRDYVIDDDIYENVSLSTKCLDKYDKVLEKFGLYGLFCALNESDDYGLDSKSIETVRKGTA